MNFHKCRTLSTMALSITMALLTLACVPARSPIPREHPPIPHPTPPPIEHEIPHPTPPPIEIVLPTPTPTPIEVVLPTPTPTPIEVVLPTPTPTPPSTSVWTDPSNYVGDESDSVDITRARQSFILAEPSRITEIGIPFKGPMNVGAVSVSIYKYEEDGTTLSSTLSGNTGASVVIEDESTTLVSFKFADGLNLPKGKYAFVLHSPFSSNLSVVVRSDDGKNSFVVMSRAGDAPDLSSRQITFKLTGDLLGPHVFVSEADSQISALYANIGSKVYGRSGPGQFFQPFALRESDGFVQLELHILYDVLDLTAYDIYINETFLTNVCKTEGDGQGPFYYDLTYEALKAIAGEGESVTISSVKLVEPCE